MNKLTVEEEDFLSEHCNKIKYEHCTTRSCVLRGSKDPENTDMNRASCVAYEIYMKLGDQS